MTIKEWREMQAKREARIRKLDSRPMTNTQLKQYFELRESRASGQR